MRQQLLPTLAAATAAILCLVGPALAGKAPPGAEAPSEAQIAVHQLRRTIAAEELVRALSLSTDQNAALSALIEGRLEHQEQEQVDRQSLAEQRRDLLERYLDELRGDGAPSSSTVAELKGLREGREEGRREGRGGREGIREELEAILGQAGMKALRDFRPMAGAAPSEEERAEARRARAERHEGRTGDELSQDDLRAMKRQRARRHHRQRLIGVLVSEAMLDALAAQGGKATR